MNRPKEEIRSQIMELVREYHASAFPVKEFIPSESTVPVSGKVFDALEMQHLVDSSLDFWLTTGRFAKQFEREFAKWMGDLRTSAGQPAPDANWLGLAFTQTDADADKKISEEELKRFLVTGA